MKTHQVKFLTILAAAALTGAIAYVSASAAMRSINFASSGFALELPETWVRVPPEIFRQRMDKLNRAIGGDQGPARLSYDYAVQLKSGKWFQYPYMLISVWEDERVDPDEIPKMNRRIEENMLKKQQAVTNVRTASANYLPEKHIYMAEFRFDLAGHPMVMLYTACYMDRGVLTFSTYMPPESYDQYAADIEHAMKSIRLSPENVYRPGKKGIRFKKQILPYLKVMIATGIVLLLVLIYMWKRRNNEKL